MVFYFGEIMDAEQILNKYLRQAVLSATEEVADYATQHHGFKSRTGNLERSITSIHSRDGLKGWVTIDRTQAPYGTYVHQGYGAFTIVPRNKKVLRWVQNGEFVFAKRVRHPGYKGDPFLFNALDASKDKVEKIFDNRVNAALREIAKGM